jgi:hypothetical protein
MHKCVRRNLFDPNPYQLLAGTSIHVQPLPTRGGGWGSREQSRRCHGGVYCDCVAYFDSRGRCFWKGFFLLNEPADGNTNQVVGSFVEKLCKAAPGKLRRGRPVEQLTHLLTYSLTPAPPPLPPLLTHLLALMLCRLVPNAENYTMLSSHQPAMSKRGRQSLTDAFVPKQLAPLKVEFAKALAFPGPTPLYVLL